MKIQNFHKVNVVLVLFVIFGLAACKKSDVKDAEPLRATEIIDEAYGTDAKNKIDVYLPAKRSDSTKVVILLHGGYWFEGDKNDVTAYAMYLRDKGFAVVNMNYRLTGTVENIHPAQQNDIAAVVDFISSKAAEWHVSSDKFGMLGVSAGAHLALLYTYANNSTGKVKTVISVAGPTNLTEIEAGTSQALAVYALLGQTYIENPSLYVQASPVARVSSLSRPTLILHGRLDVVVPIEQSESLVAKLTQLNVKNRFRTYGTGHELLNASNTQEIFDEIELWLRENIE